MIRYFAFLRFQNRKIQLLRASLRALGIKCSFNVNLILESRI